MRLYPVPGGTWEGTEADWKKAMKAKGLDPKAFEGTKTREVPTAKKDLMEFLTFFGVDVYRTGTGSPTTVPDEPEVDVEALRAIHNPTAAQQVAKQIPCGHGDAPDDRGPVPSGTLAEMFAAAPIKVQAEIAVAFIDRLTT